MRGWFSKCPPPKLRTNQVAASLLAQCCPSEHKVGFHPELFFPESPDSVDGDERPAEARGAHGSGPGPTSSEDMAAELAHQCLALRRDFLATLRLPVEGTSSSELREALRQWTAPDTTPRSPQEPAPEPGPKPPEPSAAGSSGSTPQWPAGPTRPTQSWRHRRVGLDLGGVITCQGQGHLLVAGAEAGVARLVRELGPHQVHVISRVNSPQGVKYHLAELEQANFFQKTGLDPANIHWVTDFYGPDSKGPQPSQSKVLNASISAPHLPGSPSKQALRSRG